MEFIDDEHEKFWDEKSFILLKHKKTDVYYKSIVYTLGICETTRSNFDKIFNIEKGEINIDSINSAFQTGTSEKVTRMAFSLWNRCNYDSAKDRQKGKVSIYYNPSEIFCCSYAPYFVEALKIRYPEYFREYQNSKTIEISNAEEKNNCKKYGIYSRSSVKNKCLADIEVNESVKDLLDLARKNEYNVVEIYVDEGFSGRINGRTSLHKLLNDIDNSKIDGVITQNLEQLVRDDFTNTQMLLHKIKNKGAEIIVTQDEKLQNLFELYEKSNKEIEQEIKKSTQSEKKKTKRKDDKSR